MIDKSGNRLFRNSVYIDSIFAYKAGKLLQLFSSTVSIAAM